MALACGAIVGLLAAGAYYAFNYDRRDSYDRLLSDPGLVRAGLQGALYAFAFVLLFLLCRTWVPRILSPFGKIKSASMLRLGIAAAIGVGVELMSMALATAMLRVFQATGPGGVVDERDRALLGVGLGLLAFGISAWSLFFIFGEENLKVRSQPGQSSSPTQAPTSDAGVATGAWQPQAEASEAHAIPARR
jgi:hypothetical protein